MAAIGVEIDESHILKGWNAGSPEIFIIRATGIIEEILEAGNLLGSIEFSMGKFEIQLLPGDRVLLITDGILK